ncbi:DUF4193 family protein [Nocardia nova]|uniref:DUF4193 family protein n=1 Tax=Nocardia nova TaxID=37330 RepID=UPI000CEA229F|nr:dUTPase [Nocardia nova]
MPRFRRAADTAIDADDGDLLKGVELPDADLSAEELVVYVLPKQPDEFTCGSCFLVHHRSRLVSDDESVALCRNCA